MCAAPEGTYQLRNCSHDGTIPSPTVWKRVAHVAGLQGSFRETYFASVSRNVGGRGRAQSFSRLSACSPGHHFSSRRLEVVMLVGGSVSGSCLIRILALPPLYIVSISSKGSIFTVICNT